jgi:hypothetical protein
MEKIPGVFTCSDGEIAVWVDGGIHLKAVTRHGDPVELSEEEALELADILVRLVHSERGPL